MNTTYLKLKYSVIHKFEIERRYKTYRENIIKNSREGKFTRAHRIAFFDKLDVIRTNITPQLKTRLLSDTSCSTTFSTDERRQLEQHEFWAALESCRLYWKCEDNYTLCDNSHKYAAYESPNRWDYRELRGSYWSIERNLGPKQAQRLFDDFLQLRTRLLACVLKRHQATNHPNPQQQSRTEKINSLNEQLEALQNNKSAHELAIKATQKAMITNREISLLEHQIQLKRTMLQQLKN